MLSIDNETARRYILGKQGIWPGRRWRGVEGTARAMQTMEYLQLDPLQIIARSQDIALHSRVLDYTPGLWEEAAYQQRRFFDWGGWLTTRPMEELPYWRVIMQRERDGSPDSDPRVLKMGVEHSKAVAEMRAVLQERGSVNNRVFEVAERTRTKSYRGRKDSALALYYLWRIGEVMTHHRENFERVYALAETVSPAHLLHESGEMEADRFLFKKEVSFAGLSRLNRTADAYFRGVPFSKAEHIRKSLLEEGEIIEVQVEGWKFVHYAIGSDAGLIQELGSGRLPPGWAAAERNTTEEVVLLSPLDPIVARGRAKILFNFDYVWEVYKPEQQRKYGYYTLPVLWGERLAGRFDSKLDRATNTFNILGLWLEDEKLGREADFAEALAGGFARFARFLNADRLDASAVREPLLRQCIGSVKLEYLNESSLSNPKKRGNEMRAGI